MNGMARLVARVLIAGLLVLPLAIVGCAVTPTAQTVASDSAIAKAFRDHATAVEVQDSGKVARILPDDIDGGRHQRFILRLDSGQTLLIAHNIDIAPRLAPLKPGDMVEFRGEYAWNAQGGVVHWTHHDPSGKHQTGWLRVGKTVVQ